MAIRPESKRGGKTRAKAKKKAAKKKVKTKAKKKAAKKKKPVEKAKKKGTTKVKTKARAKQQPRPRRKAAPVSRKGHAATVARLYPERIGTVTHYFAQSHAAIVKLDRAELRVGDAVHIRGHTTDFYERIEELKLDDRAVESARAGQTVGIRLARAVRENDGVFLLSE